MGAGEGLAARVARRFRRGLEAVSFWRPRRWPRERWERRWSRPDFAPPWRGRGAGPELVAAVADGWFPAGAPALDVGCGEGDVAAWLAERGFLALGVDIAPAAVALARERHGEIPGRLEFCALDVCVEPLPDRRFRVVVDRGCFHLFSGADAMRYARNLERATAPDARLLLYMKAFREGVPIGDAAERERITRMVEDAFTPAFRIQRVAETFLDPCGGRDPERALGGLVFWLQREPRG